MIVYPTGGSLQIMVKKEWKGFFEENFTLHAQSQILTVFVWVSAFVLIVSSRRYWHLGLFGNSRLLLPVLHLLPWYIAFSERNRLVDLADKDRIEPRAIFMFKQTVIRNI